MIAQNFRFGYNAFSFYTGTIQHPQITVLVRPTSGPCESHRITLYIGDHLAKFIKGIAQNTISEPQLKPLYAFNIYKRQLNGGRFAYNLNLPEYEGPPELKDSTLNIIVGSAITNFIARHPDSDIQYLMISGESHLAGSMLEHINFKIDRNGLVHGDFSTVGQMLANPLITPMALVNV